MDNFVTFLENFICTIVYMVVKPIIVFMDKIGSFKKIKAQREADIALMTDSFNNANNQENKLISNDMDMFLTGDKKVISTKNSDG